MSKQFALGALVTFKDGGTPCVVVERRETESGVLEYKVESDNGVQLSWLTEDLLKPRKTGNKYNARKVNDPEDGMFDSQAEYQRWCELKLLQSAGAISDLKRQVSLALILPIEGDDPRIKPVRYKVDFTYYEMDSALGIKKFVAEEVKGMWTDAARLKAYLFMLKYPHIKYVVTGTQL